MNTSQAVAPGLSITVERLAFDGRVLFQGLRLDLQPGRWTALLGDSGTGKTTLLRIAAGHDVGPGSYRASLSDGTPLTGRVATLPGRDTYPAGASVLAAACAGPDGEAIAADEAAMLLDAVGLSSRLDALPQTLSTGMRQRLALARVLATDRPVVLLDQPFAALDAVTKDHVLAVAHHFLTGCTVLLITGDPLEAARLADCVLLLEGDPAGLATMPPPPGPPLRPAAASSVAAYADALLRRLLGLGG